MALLYIVIIKVTILWYFSTLSISGPSNPDSYVNEDYGNEHEQRKRRLECSDPVCSISLKNTLQNQVKY